MSHQDWKPVILSKPHNPKQKRGPNDQIESVRKSTSNRLKTNEAQHLRKLDDPDAEPPKMIDRSLAQRIQRARSQKGLSQKDLAQRLNLKTEVIRDYERGTAIPQGPILAKIKRVLHL